MDHRSASLAALIAAYDGEALFRPSSADRFIGCPGSVRLIAKIPRSFTVTPWQAEGTAAHQIAEAALRSEHALEEWVDRTVKVGHIQVPIDEAFVTQVSAYLETVSSHWRPTTWQHIEYKLSLSNLDPADPLLAQNRGTADCVQVDYAQRRLAIFDLKFGRGVMVDPRSPQLKNYALMALYSFPPPPSGWDRVELHIEQPRAQDPAQRRKSVVYDPNELLIDFVGEVISAMEAALEPDPPLNPGARCRWCPAASICPALRDAALDFQGQSSQRFTAGTALGALPDQVFVGTLEQPRPMVAYPPGKVAILQEPTTLTSTELATILSRRHLWDTWITACEHRAVALLETGTEVPGWVLVRRTTRRRWKDPDKVPEVLGHAGVNGVYAPAKLKSPSQMEKGLTQAQKDLLATLVERPPGAVLLVPADSTKAALPLALGPIENDD